MALNQEELSTYRKRKERLGSMLKASSGIIQQLDMSKASDNLEQLSGKVNNDTFKIQVLGTFSNGKSTLINALIGEDVLPAYALPTTAVINEVKYGTEKRAILYFRNPLPEKIPASISPKAMAHMKKYGMKNVPPLPIEYKEIEDYVVIPMGEDPQEMLLESPYEKVELFWPLELLKEGVEIIDTPGLNESSTRTQVTQNYLTKADAILFILKADQLCTQSEMTFIVNDLNKAGFTDPFFIVNRFDMIREREQERVKKFAQMKLSEYSSNEIFFVSAQQAVDGEVNGDDELYKKSGMGAFTKRLTDFLTKDKGRIKLSQPARELKRILSNEALFKVIPGQRAMLDRSLDDVKSRYEKAKPELQTLRAKKTQVVESIKQKIESSKHEFWRTANNDYTSLATKIPGWIDAFEPSTKIGIIPSKEKINDAIKEIVDHVSKKMEEEQATWKQAVLAPVVEERTRYIFNSAEQDIKKIFEGIDEVNLEISGAQKVEIKEAPVWQRIAGAAGGLLLGDLGLAFSGGVNGLSMDLAKTAAIEIGAGFVMGLLGILNPFTAVLLLGGVMFKTFISHKNGTIKKIKDQVSESLVTQLSNSADDNSQKLANAICDKLSQVAGGISTAIDNEIHQTEEQVKGIMAEMKKGQANIDSRKKVIDNCETQIKAISNDLDTLIFELVEGK